MGFWLLNISLMLFWISLLGAGISKAVSNNAALPFSVMMQKLLPYFNAFAFSGAGVAAGLFLITIPLVRFFITKSKIALR